MIKFNNEGLVPVVVQDAMTKEVLMLAYANEEAIALTQSTKKATFFSRSRNELWVKGETSGNILEIVEIKVDCDNDTLLYVVNMAGVACHTGEYSCFFKNIEGEDAPTLPKKLQVLEEVNKTILDRKKNPKEGSYTNYLFVKGIDKILKKIAEEAGEVIIAAKNEDPAETIYEVADLCYHTLVLLAAKGIDVEEIRTELLKRTK